jgi:hypothetical protein
LPNQRWRTSQDISHESIQNNPIDPKLATLVTHGVTSLKRMTRLVIPQKSIHQF